MLSRFIALAVLALLAPAAWGQAAKADGAEAAMERAKRAAAGPLKAIQQAARIRRRGEPEPASAPTPPGAPAPASDPAVVTASAGSATVPVPGAAPAAGAELAAPPAAGALLVLGSGAAPAPAEATPIAKESLAPATAAVLPAAGVPTQPLLDLLPTQPQVLDMVEPVIPQALLEQGPKGAEVDVELSLLADGSVARVTLLPPVPRAWQRYIIAALERWRFEPMSEPRSHRVRLVFNTASQR